MAKPINTKERQEEIIKRIFASAKAGQPLNEAYFISDFCLTYGIPRRSVVEILNQLGITKKIIFVDGQIWDYKLYNKIQKTLRQGEREAAKHEKGVKK